METAVEQIFGAMALAGFILAAWNLIHLPSEATATTTAEVTADERALVLEEGTGTARAIASLTPAF